MTSLNSFFILALISLFIFGIKTISVNLLYKYKVINYIEKLPNSSNVAITSLIGLFIFCIFSNLILLLPSIIFFINNSFTHFEYFDGYLLLQQVLHPDTPSLFP